MLIESLQHSQHVMFDLERDHHDHIAAGEVDAGCHTAKAGSWPSPVLGPTL
jgi:hypothetical protein